MRQSEREAILDAFSVRYEDGTPAVDKAKLTTETGQLSGEIKARYERVLQSGETGVLALNRAMVEEMLSGNDIAVEVDKEEILGRWLSEEGFNRDVKQRLTPEQILTELDIAEDNPNYSLAKAIIVDGRRTAFAIVGLGRTATDQFSQVEDLRLRGTVFDMGLKGVDYLHRHGEYETEKEEVTITRPKEPESEFEGNLPKEVTTYKLVQTEAIGEAPPEVVEPVVLPPQAKPPPVESPISIDSLSSLSSLSSIDLTSVELTSANSIPVEKTTTLGKIFEQRKSPRLKENPKAQLDQYQEIKDYFDRQTPEYRKEVAELASQIETPPSPNLRAMVCIAVAGHQEGEVVYEALKNYTYQDFPKDQYEIILFVNWPQQDKDGNPIQPDKTLEEIARFRRDYPDMPIRVVTKILGSSEAYMGTILKYSHDIALYRQAQRGENTDDIALIFNDIDNKGIDPRYVKTLVNDFDKDPYAEGIRGQLDWDPEDYVQYPAVHIGTRLFQVLNEIGRTRQSRKARKRLQDETSINTNFGRVPSSGASFACRGSIYAAVGGTLENLPKGSNVALGAAIVAARGNDTRRIQVGNSATRLYTSTRRAIVRFLEEGLSPVEQWDKKGDRVGFSVFDDQVRRFQTDSSQRIDYSDPTQIEGVKKSMELVIDRTLDRYDSGERIGKKASYYRKALGLLGIRYDLDADGRVVITNMDQVVANLRRYQEIAVEMRDRRSGKGKREEEQFQTLKVPQGEQIKPLPPEEQKQRVEQTLTSFTERLKSDTPLVLDEQFVRTYLIEPRGVLDKEQWKDYWGKLVSLAGPNRAKIDIFALNQLFTDITLRQVAEIEVKPTLTQLPRLIKEEPEPAAPPTHPPSPGPTPTLELQTMEQIALTIEKYRPNDVPIEAQAPVETLTLTAVQTLLTSEDLQKIDPKTLTVVLSTCAKDAAERLTTQASERGRIRTIIPNLEEKKSIAETMLRGVRTARSADLGPAEAGRYIHLLSDLDYDPAKVKVATLLQGPEKGGGIPTELLPAEAIPVLQAGFAQRYSDNLTSTLRLTPGIERQLTRADLDYLAKVTALQLFLEYKKTGTVTPYPRKAPTSPPPPEEAPVPVAPAAQPPPAATPPAAVPPPAPPSPTAAEAPIAPAAPPSPVVPPPREERVEQAEVVVSQPAEEQEATFITERVGDRKIIRSANPRLWPRLTDAGKQSKVIQQGLEKIRERLAADVGLDPDDPTLVELLFAMRAQLPELGWVTFVNKANGLLIKDRSGKSSWEFARAKGDMERFADHVQSVSKGEPIEVPFREPPPWPTVVPPEAEAVAPPPPEMVGVAEVLEAAVAPSVGSIPTVSPPPPVAPPQTEVTEASLGPEAERPDFIKRVEIGQEVVADRRAITNGEFCFGTVEKEGEVNIRQPASVWIGNNKGEVTASGSFCYVGKAQPSFVYGYHLVHGDSSLHLGSVEPLRRDYDSWVGIHGRSSLFYESDDISRCHLKFGNKDQQLVFVNNSFGQRRAGLLAQCEIGGFEFEARFTLEEMAQRLFVVSVLPETSTIISQPFDSSTPRPEQGCVVVDMDRDGQKGRFVIAQAVNGSYGEKALAVYQLITIVNPEGQEETKLVFIDGRKLVDKGALAVRLTNKTGFDFSAAFEQAEAILQPPPEEAPVAVPPPTAVPPAASAAPAPVPSAEATAEAAAPVMEVPPPAEAVSLEQVVQKIADQLESGPPNEVRQAQLTLTTAEFGSMLPSFLEELQARVPGLRVRLTEQPQVTIENRQGRVRLRAHLKHGLVSVDQDLDLSFNLTTDQGQISYSDLQAQPPTITSKVGTLNVKEAIRNRLAKKTINQLLQEQLQRQLDQRRGNLVEMVAVRLTFTEEGALEATISGQRRATKEEERAKKEEEKRQRRATKEEARQKEKQLDLITKTLHKAAEIEKKGARGIVEQLNSEGLDLVDVVAIAESWTDITQAAPPSPAKLWAAREGGDAARLREQQIQQVLYNWFGQTLMPTIVRDATERQIKLSERSEFTLRLYHALRTIEFPFPTIPDTTTPAKLDQQPEAEQIQKALRVARLVSFILENQPRR